MIDKLHSFKLPSLDYGEVFVAPLRMVGETWGILEPLRKTPWGKLIPIIPGEVMAGARHGRSKPLMQVIGRPPHALMRFVPKDMRVCAEQKTCGSFRVKDCHPCVAVPECYEPPDLSPEAAHLARLITLAWKEGIYVVLVEGEEFSY